MTQPASGPAAKATEATKATYVFAVARTLDPAVVAELDGMNTGEPVRALPLGSLVGVVQSVPADDFTDDAWQQRLSDPQNLERCARSHHEVVSAAAAHGSAVPLPLATLYLSDARARQALEGEADRFHAVLRRIAHHAEWGVKVYSPPASPPAGALRPAPSADRGRPAPGAGLAYLERKRGLQQRREQHHEQSLRIAEEVDAELGKLATAARRLRPHGHRPSDGQGSQLLNAAYLVAEHRAHEFAALTRAWCGRAGARIEISGPWVPYSFVSEV
ncbi:GvpL/GvpF family gas vesicle protein [Streptomyces purpurogeneiscleroticus]|uniref:GvpL/GvpF family gas vesicle protein n=1 Tax=Streptomyces purpurogeneiscleroticus TaxID=68259 RepID=UPI001CBD8D8D|nr:GvpL/GvpF family gas vesicle protein [Streptomyces purpurogeneiscleroticus]MBZ4014964.1 gas vesicle protein [Streptomyces purpurogeneiscleroticus]